MSFLSISLVQRIVVSSYFIAIYVAILSNTAYSVEPTPTPSRALPSQFVGDECDELRWFTNIAERGYATSQGNIGDHQFAINGDIDTPGLDWFSHGQNGWWQVELPCEIEIYKIELFPPVYNFNDFFYDYQILGSLNGHFTGEEFIIAHETNRPQSQWVTYEIPPVLVKFIRIVPKDEHPWARLQEFRAYPAVEPTPTMTPTITPTATVTPLPTPTLAISNIQVAEIRQDSYLMDDDGTKILGHGVARSSIYDEEENVHVVASSIGIFTWDLSTGELLSWNPRNVDIREFVISEEKDVFSGGMSNTVFHTKLSNTEFINKYETEFKYITAMETIGDRVVAGSMYHDDRLFIANPTTIESYHHDIANLTKHYKNKQLFGIYGIIKTSLESIIVIKFRKDINNDIPYSYIEFYNESLSVLYDINNRAIINDFFYSRHDDLLDRSVFFLNISGEKYLLTGSSMFGGVLNLYDIYENTFLGNNFYLRQRLGEWFSHTLKNAESSLEHSLFMLYHMTAPQFLWMLFDTDTIDVLCIHQHDKTDNDTIELLHVNTFFGNSPRFSISGDFVTVFTNTHIPQIFDSGGRNLYHNNNTHIGPVNGVGYSEKKKTFITSHGLPVFGFSEWDKATGRNLLSIKIDTFQHGMNHLTIINEGEHALFSQRYNEIIVWDILKHEIIDKINSPRGGIKDIQYISDSNAFAVGYFSGYVDLFDFDSRERISSHKAFETPIESMAYNPESRVVVVTSRCGRARIYSIDSWDFINEFYHLGSPIQASAFNPNNSNEILLGDFTGNLFWVDYGEETAKLFPAFESAITDIVVSQDGSSVFVSSWDGAIKRFLRDGEDLIHDHTFEGHTAAVKNILLIDDDQSLVSGSLDGTVRIWQADIIGNFIPEPTPTPYIPGVAEYVYLAMENGDAVIRWLWSSDVLPIRFHLHWYVDGVYVINHHIAGDTGEKSEAGYEYEYVIQDVGFTPGVFQAFIIAEGTGGHGSHVGSNIITDSDLLPTPTPPITEIENWLLNDE